MTRLTQVAPGATVSSRASQQRVDDDVSTAATTTEAPGLIRGIPRVSAFSPGCNIDPEIAHDQLRT